MRYFKYLGRLLKEIWGYAMENKAWWLIPLVIVLLLFAILILTTQGASIPFIYTLW